MEATQKITSFTQLTTWQEGHSLVLMVYECCDKFPQNELFILRSQILRSAISITSNIAEGFSRQSQKEKKQFYYIAKGSLTELQNQLLIAKDRSYISQRVFKKIANQSVVVHKLLYGLIRSARSR